MGPLLARSPVLLSEWELWACANQVLTTHGDKAAVYVAEQLGALALKGDAKGIAAWQEIARRIEQLQANPDDPAARH